MTAIGTSIAKSAWKVGGWKIVPCRMPNSLAKTKKQRFSTTLFRKGAFKLSQDTIWVPPFLNSQNLFAGAFPEVRQAQFPLGMGKSDNKSQGTLAVTLGSDGQVNYDSVLKQSRLADKTVASTHGALVPKLDDINRGVLFPYQPLTPQAILNQQQEKDLIKQHSSACILHSPKAPDALRLPICSPASRLRVFEVSRLGC